MRICELCKAEIVYGYAASSENEGKKFICDECYNTLNSGHGPDGVYEPPALFPIRQPGHC